MTYGVAGQRDLGGHEKGSYVTQLSGEWNEAITGRSVFTPPLALEQMIKHAVAARSDARNQISSN